LSPWKSSKKSPSSRSNTDLIVITDEFSELIYDKDDPSKVPSAPPLSPFRECGSAPSSCTASSKAYAMTGYRLHSYAPNIITDAMMKVHQYSMLCASIIAQRLGSKPSQRP